MEREGKKKKRHGLTSRNGNVIKRTLNTTEKYAKGKKKAAHHTLTPCPRGKRGGKEHTVVNMASTRRENS